MVYFLKEYCFNVSLEKGFLANQIRYLRFYPGIENVILPLLSYTGRQVTSSCEIASSRVQGLLEAY